MVGAGGRSVGDDEGIGVAGAENAVDGAAGGRTDDFALCAGNRDAHPAVPAINTNADALNSPTTSAE